MSSAPAGRYNQLSRTVRKRPVFVGGLAYVRAVRQPTKALDRAVWTRAWVGPGRPLHLLAARFVRHHFAPHTHEEFSIGVCGPGVGTIRYRGTRWLSTPGTIVVVEPGEPHTGGPAQADGYAYRALYPPVDLVTGASGTTLPRFRSLVIEDPRLAAELRRTHTALAGDTDRFAAESRLTSVLAALVLRHATDVEPPRPTVAAHRIAEATMARLTDRLTEPPSLQDIAVDLGVSRFQVLRGFRDAVGMPPYAWLAQYRVTRAKTLLEAGLRPAEVAARVGFADQAHLTRWFRRVVGVTPGAFRNSVQDGPAANGDTVARTSGAEER